MSVRDPNSADANAQAPVDHPDAQVRVDQSVKLTGVQQPKYPDRVVLEPATEGNAQPQSESVEPSGDQPAPGDISPAPAAAGGEQLEPQLEPHEALSHTEGDPIPDGEVKPDATAPADAEVSGAGNHNTDVG